MVFSLASCVGKKHTHSLTHTEAKSATCTEDGNIEYWSCSDCEKKYSDESAKNELEEKDIVINRLAHIFSDEWESDCYAHWYKAICSHQEIKDYAPHTFQDGYCSLCNAEKKMTTEGVEYLLNPDNVSYRVVGTGTATDTDIIIPDTYNDYPVTSIGGFAFDVCNNLTSVTFENPNGWWYASSSADISSTDLADTSIAATYLKSTYCNYYWKRK